ncbi:MAG: hypothetical protein ACREHD_15270 [Pirellulales bacterium]
MMLILMRTTVYKAANCIGVILRNARVDQIDFWQPPRPCPQRISPQQCPFFDLMIVQPLDAAYSKAA